MYMPLKFSLILRLKSIIFYRDKPKIKLVFQKIKIFLSAGGFALRPSMASGGAPRPPNTASLATADF